MVKILENMLGYDDDDQDMTIKERSVKAVCKYWLTPWIVHPLHAAVWLASCEPSQCSRSSSWKGKSLSKRYECRGGPQTVERTIKLSAGKHRRYPGKERKRRGEGELKRQPSPFAYLCTYPSSPPVPASTLMGVMLIASH